MVGLKPQDIRNKIMGVLYQAYSLDPRGLTKVEIAQQTGIPLGALVPELVHLMDTGDVRIDYGPDIREPGGRLLYLNNLAEPNWFSDARFSITAQGREKMEKGGREKMPGERKVLKSTSQDIGLAESRMAEARSATVRARKQLTDSDHSGSLAQSQRAIEFAAKALLPLVGFEGPEEHFIGYLMEPLVLKVKGEDYRAKKARATIARVAWINMASGPTREVSDYGYLKLPAREIVESRDARLWLEYAEEVTGAVDQLVIFVKQGTVSLSTS